MTDHLSNDQAMEPFDRGNPARRCTAHKKTGERCRKWAIQGGTVCTHHGGNSAHVKRKARQRLEDASDRMAKALLGMATDENVSEGVRLAAIKDALSRAGVTEKTAVEVEVALRPWERILSDLSELETGSRAAYRASAGRPDPEPPVALPDGPSPDANGIVDAVIVSDEPDGERLIAAMAARPRYDDDEPDTFGDDEHAPTGRSARNPVPPNPMMSMQDAAIVNADMLTRTRGRLALPPGRSSK